VGGIEFLTNKILIINYILFYTLFEKVSLTCIREMYERNLL